MCGGTNAPTSNGCSTIDRAPPLSAPSILKTTPTPGARPPARPSPGRTTFNRAPVATSMVITRSSCRFQIDEQGCTMNVDGADVKLSDQMRSTKSRPYRMRRRATHVAETRQRITEAAVHLHTTVGPATDVDRFRGRGGRGHPPHGVPALRRPRQPLRGVHRALDGAQPSARAEAWRSIRTSRPGPGRLHRALSLVPGPRRRALPDLPRRGRDASLRARRASGRERRAWPTRWSGSRAGPMRRPRATVSWPRLHGTWSTSGPGSRSCRSRASTTPRPSISPSGC